MENQHEKEQQKAQIKKALGGDSLENSYRKATIIQRKTINSINNTTTTPSTPGQAQGSTKAQGTTVEQH